VATTPADGPRLRLTGKHRLPPPGTVLVRPYKGQTLQVRVLAKGFAYEGKTYRSLSAVAKAITRQEESELGRERSSYPLVNRDMSILY
jgi:hypothetical protein